jgi:preprotein translocase subunit SecF
MGAARRLYYGDTAVDFVGKARIWFGISGIIILLGLASLFTNGLNFGIDFQGGTAWEIANTDVQVDDARAALREFGLGDSTIQVLGGTTLKVQAEPVDEATVTAVRDALAELADVPAGDVSISEVGPSWGESITAKAQRALVLFLLAVTLYISLRFEWKMALTAILALLHDIVLTVGVYSISGFQVTPTTVIAFLTILGFSLYDSVIIFDKIDENTKGLAATGRLTYSATVNLSTNQMLMRSINTSIVAILPILSVLVVGALILGASTLQDFGLSMLVGLTAGIYSSLFIAPPVLAWLKEREPRYASIRKRLENRGDVGPAAPTAAAVLRPGASKPAAPAASTAPSSSMNLDAPTGESGSAVQTSEAPKRPSPSTVTPRGRKKKRRR